MVVEDHLYWKHRVPSGSTAGLRLTMRTPFEDDAGPETVEPDDEDDVVRKLQSEIQTLKFQVQLNLSISMNLNNI